jgi:septal ring factor EnvC (AmiA/AmiB activator)
MLANSLGKTEKVAWGRELFLPEGHMTAVVETTETVVKTTVGKTKIKVRKTTESIITRASRRFRWPVMGQISSNFGWRRSPFGRRRAFHAGLDIRAPRGRPIQAAGDGRVVYAGWMSGYGKAVVVEHASGLTTLYGHCSSLCVGRGTVVHAGRSLPKWAARGARPATTAILRCAAAVRRSIL